jgi:SAM-dependent methyltransferase
MPPVSRTTARILTSYPHRRPALPEPHRERYVAEYKLNREGGLPVTRLTQQLESWMHRRIASISGGPILEIGAGTLNHLCFEKTDVTYDVVEPFRELLQERPDLTRVRRVFDGLSEVPLGEKYARIISIAVLEHMEELPFEIATSCRHLAEGGVFQAAIPSEGALLWWLGWRLTTGISYWIRHGLDYGALMRHEHVNKAPEILALVRYFFASVTVSRFPLPLHQLSFYTYVEARDPIASRVDSFLRCRSSSVLAS